MTSLRQEQNEWGITTTRPQRVGHHYELVSWCFKPSQPQGITSGLIITTTRPERGAERRQDQNEWDIITTRPERAGNHNDKTKTSGTSLQQAQNEWGITTTKPERVGHHYDKTRMSGNIPTTRPERAGHFGNMIRKNGTSPHK